MDKGSRSILEIQGISKSFPGGKALNDISFSIEKGEIRALSGENGAGKSTIIKILTGVYSCDKGKIFLDGEQVKFTSTQESQQKGVRAVYQELNLIPYLSVAENLFLGEFPMKRTGINWQLVYQEAERCLHNLNIDIDPHAIINDLGAAAQQMVAIAIAVKANCRLLILDEPTSSLDKKEVSSLFSAMRSLKGKGVAIIFITHRMEEIYQICDSITVLKNGENKGTYSVDELNQNKLVRLMVGSDIQMEDHAKKSVSNEDKIPAIELKNARSGRRVNDISFRVYPGEILGIAGLLGSGRSETMQLLSGCRKLEAGEIYISGKLVRLSGPADAVSRHIVYCTENRRVDGIVPNMSVENNLVLANLKKLSQYGVINKQKKMKIVDEYIDKFKIKTPSKDQPIKYLSGGNQQKVLLARGLATTPEVILLDEPTRGIDVGAKQEILGLIRDMADQGIAVVVITSDLSELVRISDRITVFKEGVSIAELKGDEINHDNIMKAIAGGEPENSEVVSC